MDANTIFLAIIAMVNTFQLFIIKDLSSRQRDTDERFIDHLKDHP